MYYSWREPKEPHMQVTIEIPDGVLREAIAAQVGAQLSTITSQLLDARALEILEKRMSRINPEEIAASLVKAQINEAVTKELNTVLGVPSYQRRKWVEDRITEIAMNVFKKAVEE
jgi:hypothetical protein